MIEEQLVSGKSRERNTSMSRMTLTFNVASGTEGPTVSHSEYDFTLGIFLPLLDLVRQGPYDGRVERVERFGTVEFVSPGRALGFEEHRGGLLSVNANQEVVSTKILSDVR
jgi:hypothetical protein